jgi:hypothetical protein
MCIQFSIESIEYLAEKFNNCQSLSHESLAYLTLQISELISNLLQVIIEINQSNFFCMQFDLGCV